MFIQMRRIVVTAGSAEQVVARFSKPGPIDAMEGLVDKTIMSSKISREEEEVLVMIRWESRDAWMNWERAMHICRGIGIKRDRSLRHTSSAPR